MKSFNAKNLLRVGFFLLVMGLLSFGFSCKKAAEKTNEKLIEQAIGEDAKVDIDDEKMVIETEEGTFTTDASAKSWPSEIPDLIPEFTDGKVVIVNTQQMADGMGWVVVFEDVPNDAAKKYKELLKSKGFETNVAIVIKDNENIIAEKDDWIVALMAGEGKATVSISKEK